jgi:hypothetical protein
MSPRIPSITPVAAVAALLVAVPGAFGYTVASPDARDANVAAQASTPLSPDARDANLAAIGVRRHSHHLPQAH